MRAWVMGLCALLSLGCAAPGVVRGGTTTPETPRTGAVYVIGQLGRPQQTVGTAASPADAMMSVENGIRRLDRAERALHRLYDSQLNDTVVAAADLGPSGAPQPAFLISYRMLNYQEHFDGPDGRYWVGLIFGSMTGGLLWLLAIDSHANSTHTFEYEVRVFDVRGAPMVRVADRDGTFTSAYDTSVAAPLMRRTYSGQMNTWIGSGTNGPGGADLERFMAAQGTELARVMFDQSVADVQSAVVRGLQTRVLAAQPPSSGGEQTQP